MPENQTQDEDYPKLKEKKSSMYGSKLCTMQDCG